MKAGVEVIPPQEKQNRLQIGFTVIGGCASLIAGALSPFLTYFLLFGIAYHMATSYRRWTTLHLPQPQENFVLDLTDKMMAFGGFTLVSLLLWQFYPLAQIILCGGAGAALSFVFIQHFVIDSQLALNTALQRAVREFKGDLVTTLLERGADPFAVDELGNNCFHLAIDDNANALPILQALQATAKKPTPTFKELMVQGKALFNESITRKWLEVGISLRNNIRSKFQDNDRAALAKALEELASAYQASFRTIINFLTTYCRQRLAFEINIEQKNKAGLKPSDLFDRIKNTLNDMPAAHRRQVAPILRKEEPAPAPEVTDTSGPAPTFLPAALQALANPVPALPAPGMAQAEAPAQQEEQGPSPKNI